MLKDKFKVSGWWAAAPLIILCSMGIVTELRLVILPLSSSFSSSSFLLPLPPGVQHRAWGASQGSAELVHPWSSSESQNPQWQCWNSCTSLCWILPSVSYAWWFSYVWMCLHQNHVLLVQARDGKCPWTKLCSGSIFFSRHAKMNFTKNPDKYLKYSPDSLDSKLRSFFDGGVWIWSVEN